MKERLDTPARSAYKIDTGPIPLDVLLVNQPGQPKGACWYRLPSWRVFFDCEALEGVDVRLHRSGESSAVWVLTEASTGARIFADLPQDFYIGDEGAMLTEFAASTMPKLTKEKVAKAIAAASERLKEYPPNPFVARSESEQRFIRCVWVVEREFGYGKAMRVVASDHPRFVVGSRFDYGFLDIAVTEGYRVQIDSVPPHVKHDMEVQREERRSTHR